LTSIFTELFKKAEGNWILPVLNVVIVNLRMIAKKVGMFPYDLFYSNHILGRRSIGQPGPKD